MIGISRDCEYSPNHLQNDAAIFSIVANYLKGLGCEIHLYTEKEFTENRIDGDIFFCMARGKDTLHRLKILENKGALVINSPYGIGNCIRQPMTELLISHHIPHPESIISPVNMLNISRLNYPCWIKRGDSHTIVKNDVCFAPSPDAAAKIIDDFKHRNISSAVINKHLYGDLIKFYGISGTEFFHWFYPSLSLPSKFGLERINGEAKGIPFDKEELKMLCNRASKILNVPIYGGDCIIQEDGNIMIIDFNDWPSFARYRNEAGQYIASFIYKQAKEFIGKKKRTA